MAGKGVSLVGSLLLVLTFLSWTLSSAQYTPKTAILDDDVALTCNTFCKGPRTWTDLDGKEVAHCEVDGRCRYGYENIKMSNDSKDGKRSLDLVISPVHFNDQGVYLGSCDGHHCVYKLLVLAPQRVIAYTGENTTIPCYAVTNKNKTDQQIYLRWDKNGEMGVKLAGGVLTHGVIPMDRGRISKDGYRKGNLSLPLDFVRPSDAGHYQCHCSPMGDTDNFQGAPNSGELEVRVSTFQVQDDALVTVPVISDGPVAVTFKGHDGGPEVEVCTLSEGQQQCTPQHGGMFAMQDAKLTFTRGSSTRGGVYFLKDKDSGGVLYRFNVTRAVKEASSWICWGTALGIIGVLGPAQVISCIRHQDLATLISSLYTWLIGQVRRRRSDAEEVTHSPVPQSEEDEEVTHSEVQQSEEDDVKISVEVVDEFELKTESSTRRIEE